MNTNGAPANGHANGHANGTVNDQLSFDFYQAKEQWEGEAASAKTTGWKHTTLSGDDVDLLNTPHLLLLRLLAMLMKNSPEKLKRQRSDSIALILLECTALQCQ